MHTQSHTDTRFGRLAAMVIAGFALASFATLSSARSYDPLRVTVHFADLDVSRAEGAALLYSRIRRAAREVCSPIASRGYYDQQLGDACIDAAITDAVNTVNRPALYAAMNAKRATSTTVRLVSQSR